MILIMRWPKLEVRNLKILIIGGEGPLDPPFFSELLSSPEGAPTREKKNKRIVLLKYKYQRAS